MVLVCTLLCTYRVFEKFSKARLWIEATFGTDEHKYGGNAGAGAKKLLQECLSHKAGASSDQHTAISVEILHWRRSVCRVVVVPVTHHAPRSLPNILQYTT